MSTLILLMNGAAKSWFRFCATGLRHGLFWIVIVTLIWRLAKHHFSAQFGYCLSCILMLSLVSPVEVLIPSSWCVPFAVSPYQEQDFVPSGTSVQAIERPQLGDGGYHASTIIRLDKSATPQFEFEPSRPVLTWQAIAMIVWGLWTCAGCLRLLWIHRRTRRLVATSKQVDDLHVLLDFASLKRTFSANQNTRLLTSDRLSSPVAVGVFRPSILLPTELLAKLSSLQLRWTLAHELAHIRRRD